MFIDGGVTRGTECVQRLALNPEIPELTAFHLSVLKALCLGAKGVGLGRSMLYAQVRTFRRLCHKLC